MLTQQFEVIPAVDVLEGRAVRLRGGRRDAVTFEGGDPVELARRFAAEGARRLHVVDLDGAFSGAPSTGLLERLVRVGVPVQVGGGYRSVAAVTAALGAGADRVIVGTAALSPGFLTDVLGVAGDHVLVAIDVADGKVTVGGWTEGTDVTPAAFARHCSAAGVTRLLVTSTARDGSLEGPDASLLAAVLPVGLPVLAAGGISSLGDLTALRELGCEGAVVGSALLAGRFTLPEAQAALTS
ncbi:MAG: 1-(5-phosphoribosyl)-5-[(5-phosphoribosylamino)methylideneamino] imidazole-4-carboxamide isomerase [Thermoleophilia bacterium]|nr:1-(5-phosphoribosyl)-5-[(5-phosphoribosylamino)methylideneamino] imidazole-4-carboxamide isomerase [Thermoleophilia bacterium]